MTEAAGIEVVAPCGAVAGTIGDHGVARFLGIPYAEAPFGPNRFRPPVPRARWDGIHDGTRPGLACPQIVLDPNDAIQALFNPGPYGDDCLNLNVWTPAPSASAGVGGLPVLVWIHGGGFVNGCGTSPMHEGTNFARDGVVSVSINYRLGPEGFLWLGEGTGNLGLLDQVAALRWVQDNIAAFGGDPANVTVAGQSAGAVSTMELLALPAAKGLFRRAIPASGSSLGAEPLDGAVELAAAFASRAGVEPTPEGIASVPMDRLLAVAASFCIEYLSPALWGARSFMISPFRPAIDGSVLPSSCLDTVAAGTGAAAGVDLLVGTTRDECTFAMYPLGLLDEVPEVWADLARGSFGLTTDDLDAYRKGTRPGAGEPELLMAAWTDWAFRVPSIRLIEAQLASGVGGSSYLYEFAWPSPTMPALGAAHDIDHAFAFDILGSASSALEHGLGPLNPLGLEPPQALADDYHGAWVRFVTTGDPGWAPYDLDRRATMRFDVASEVVDDLAGVERELWTGRR